MEAYQKEHLTNNLKGLVSTTVLSAGMLSKFQECSIFTDDELNSLLNAATPNGTRVENFYKKLLSIEKCNTSVYDMLLDSLRSTGQDSALELATTTTMTTVNPSTRISIKDDEVFQLVSNVSMSFTPKSKQSDKYQNSIFMIAQNSWNDPPMLLQTKIIAINYILDLDKSLVDSRPSEQGTFLFSRIHVEILKTLIGARPNLNIKGNPLENILFQALEYLNPQQYHELVDTMASHGYADKLKQKQEDGSTILHEGVFRMELQSSTIQTLLALGLNLNDVCNCGFTVFLNAVRGGRTSSYLNMLIQLGADWRITTQRTRRSALYLAVANSDVDVIEFLCHLGIDINLQDYAQNTPLHRAVTMDCNGRTFRIIEALLKLGANLDVLNFWRRSPRTLFEEQAWNTTSHAAIRILQLLKQ